ncbi:hypothetical protein [Cellvibrio fontiphilus]|uniref:Uncharacterized protein n=1 Tax=Cellvibrio fontiphilus TaxID=1815559 RepID=A0ABV7FD11_9GAMM
MNKISLLVLLILISIKASAIDLSTPENKVSCPELGNSFECALKIEKSIIALNKGIISRKNESLEIVSAAGDIHHIKENKNKDDSEATVHVLAVGVSDDKRFVSLYVQYFEGNSWSIFDRKTAVLTPVCGFPMFSPENNYVAFSEMNPYTEMTPTCLQVYQVKKNEIRKVFEASTENIWWPEKTKWVTKEKLIFKRAEWNPSRSTKGQPDFIFKDYSLQLDNGAWKMVKN